jgi:hypothetical protein
MGESRDSGDYAFDFYTVTKNVAVVYDMHKGPRIGVAAEQKTAAYASQPFVEIVVP